MSRLLLLEDDDSLIDGLQYALMKNGFELEVARTLREARQLLNFGEGDGYDLLLLDLSLPDGKGFEICDMVRKKGSNLPIIYLTASDEETNIIRGLDGGGDDYVTKPFRLGELCSRIRALLRRSAGMERKSEEKERLQSGDLVIDLVAGKAILRGKPLELTSAEYRLLCLLVKNAGRILPREVILNALWDGNGNFVDDNTLSVYVRRLREKMEEDPSCPRCLLTVRGFGYQWKEEGE